MLRNLPQKLFYLSREKDPTSYFFRKPPPSRKEAEDATNFRCFFNSRINDPTSYFFKWNAEETERALKETPKFDLRTGKKEVSIAFAKAELAAADCVCFDVDSTVCVGEGIDDLAEHCGVLEEVKQWTNAAMGGQMKFEVALAARLDIIKPSRSDFDHCALKAKLTPGAKEFIQLLHSRNISTYLVSGGFRLMIQPVAAELEIQNENIYANTVFFDDEGRYTHFDPSEPTSHDGGKAEAVQKIIEARGYETVIMIGDGVTDLQARPPAKVAIGFGGNQCRPAVIEHSDWFVRSFDELSAVFKRRRTQ